MRRLSGLAVCCLLLSACGSSGNTTVFIPTTPNSPVISSPTPNPKPATHTPTHGSGGGATPTPTATHSGGATSTPARSAAGGTGTPTPTRVSAAGKTLYVRTSGNDTNAGTSPGAALQTVAQAVKLMGAGTTVYVGPGSYTEPGKGLVLISGNGGTASAPIQIIADPTGAQTGDAPGDVILDANSDSVAVQLDNAPFVIIDGFTITGAVPAVTVPTPGATPVTGTATEIEVLKSSDNVTIRNCVIGQSAASNGIRIDASVDVLVFNNLIIENDRGIVITAGATGAQIINNTIVTTKHQALDLTQKGMVAPTGAMVLNNIIEAQTDKVAISVGQGPPSSQDGYVGDFNVVFESTATDQSLDYSPNGMSGTTAIRGANDLNVDPLLINLGAGDVHLSHDSPAIDAGTEMIDSSLIDMLTSRSTRNDNSLDRPPVDRGYHYPVQ